MSLKAPLSPLEQAVMQVVWLRQPVPAAAIQAALRPGRELKDSTIRTVLTRLEEKRYLKHQVDGRTFLYRSVDAPRNLAVRAVKQLVDRFCQGSVESLLVGMVDDEMVDAEELRRIAARLAKQRRENERVAGARKRKSK